LKIYKSKIVEQYAISKTVALDLSENSVVSDAVPQKIPESNGICPETQQKIDKSCNGNGEYITGTIWHM
jgi:hypothetical protein